ncbi:MAG: DUF3999 family protein [Kiritimatiellae bacterium]|nr:DUF3999 family protein [Kiritimatiellia bacterium]
MTVRSLCPPALLVVLATAVVAAARVEPERFPFRKELERPAGAARPLASFLLDDDLYAATDAGYANIRLVDENGAEIPFLVRVKTHTATQTTDSVVGSRIIGFEELDDNRVSVIVEKTDEKAMPDAVEIVTGARNYEKSVSVAGSHNRSRWKTLAADQPVFDYSKYVDVRNNRVEIRPENFRYYRIDIARFVEERAASRREVVTERRGDAVFSEIERKTLQTEHLRVEQINLRRRIQAEQRDKPFRKAYAIGPVDVGADPKKQLSTWTFGSDRQPLVSLSFDTKSRNFSRSFQVEGAASAEKPKWQGLGNFTLYSLHLGEIQRESLTVPLRAPCRHRQYRVTVHNGDNPVLDIVSITATGEVYEAVFLPAVGARYAVLYGGEGIEMPRYDIRSILAAAPAVEAEVWALGEELANPLYTSGPRWAGAKIKALFVAAVTLMVGLLFWLITRGAARVQAGM